MGHANIFHANAPVVGRHIEGPEHFLDLEAFAVGGSQKGCNTVTIAGLAAGARKDQIMLGFVYACIPCFSAVDNPLITIAHRGGFHMRCITAVIGFGNTESETRSALGEIIDPGCFLLLRAVFDHQQQADIVTHNGVLILQVVVQTQT